MHNTQHMERKHLILKNIELNLMRMLQLVKRRRQPAETLFLPVTHNCLLIFYRDNGDE